MLKKITLIAAAMFFNAAAQLSGPVISSPDQDYDFGEVVQGEVVEHEFVIENNGDDMLIIDKVMTSCGCTAAEPETKEIKPGKSTTIKVKFSSSGRRGPQQKHITVVNNDKRNSYFQFSLTGNVITKDQKENGIPKIELSSAEHDFGTIKEGEIVEYTFTFKNAGNKDLVIKDVRTSCGCTAAILSGDVINPGEEGELKVEFNSANRKGDVRKIVTLITNDPASTYTILTIFANVKEKES